MKGDPKRALIYELEFPNGTDDIQVCVVVVRFKSK